MNQQKKQEKTAIPEQQLINNIRNKTNVDVDKLYNTRNYSQNSKVSAMEAVSDKLQDQSRVPAAMRTSLFFGDVMFDDDIKKTKELERKKWLQELENQKKEKLIEKEFLKEKDKIMDLKKEQEARLDLYEVL